MTVKAHAAKALARLDSDLRSFTLAQHLRKHKLWLASELQQLILDHGLILPAIGVIAGGEGVQAAPAARNANQLQPKANNLQWAQQAPVEAKFTQWTGLEPGKAQEQVIQWTSTDDSKQGMVQELSEVEAKRYPLSITTVYSDGATVHKPLAQTPDGWPLNGPGGTLTVSEGVDTVVMTNEAVEAKNVVPEAVKEVETIWPNEVEVQVTGFCLNPRLLSGKIVEGGRMGREVTLWRGRNNYRAGSVLKCQLDEVRGKDARYLPV